MNTMNAQELKDFMKNNQIVYLDGGELSGDYVFAIKKDATITIASPTLANVRLSYKRVYGETHNQSPVFRYNEAGNIVTGLQQDGIDEE